MIRLTTLGQLTLSSAERPLLAGRRKLLALLAYLSRQRGRPVARSFLASLLWPSVDEGRARQSLRTAITELRAAVPNALESDGDEIRLLRDIIELDADMLEAEIASGDFATADRRWGGDFLAGLDDVGDGEWRAWLEAERERLRHHVAFALERLAAASESEGRWDEAVVFAERWIQLRPADERAASRLIVALRAAGRESDAEARHAALARQIEELNAAPPSPAFQRLARAKRVASTTSPGVRALLTPDLVGRERALASLTASWQHVRDGGGCAVLLEGERGLGKSRIVDEFVRFLRAASGERTIVLGRAFASERERPLSTLRLLLDQLADAPGLAAAPPEVLAALGAKSSAIAARFQATGGPPVELSDAVLRALSDVAFEAPVVIILDDATCADLDSLAILDALLRRTPPRVLVLLAGDPADWPSAAHVEEWRRLAHLASIDLKPLSPDDSRRLVESVAPMEPDTARALAARLHAESGGKPGQLHALLRLLVERGMLAPGRTGHFEIAADPARLELPIPDDLGLDVQHRVRALAPDARQVLEAAAVLGPRIRPELLEQVSGLGTESYRSATADLLARRLLRGGQAPDGVFEFPGEAECRATYAQIVPSSRRVLHRAAARALAKHGRGEVDRAEIAAHRSRGGRDSRTRALIASGVALVLLAALAGVWRTISVRAAVPAGTRVLLAGVQNLTSDSTLDSTLELPVRIALQQSQHVSLVPTRQVTDVLGRMRQSMPAAGLDEKLAREVALRENLPAFIHIAISAVDSTYLLTGRIVDPDDGRELYATRVSALGRGQIIPAVDELLRRVRTALGESRLVARSIEQSLPRVTTSSLEALQLYSVGRIEWGKNNGIAAKQLWARAVELDTTFALALAALGDFYFVYGDIGIDQAQGNRYYDRALAHADRLTERERLALQATVARRRELPDEALAKLRRLSERYPDRDTWYNYGTFLMRQQRWSEAIPILRRTVMADSMYTFGWVNLATSHHGAGAVDSALAAYEHASRTGDLVWRGGNVNQEWGRTLLLAGRAARAESIFTVGSQTGDVSERSGGMRALAWLDMYTGRYRRARGRLDEATVLAERAHQALTIARNLWLHAGVNLDLGDLAAARHDLDRSERALGSLATDPIFLFYLADLRLRTGDVAAARQLAHRIVSSEPANPDNDGIATMLRAELSLRDGRADSAILDARRVAAAGLLGFRDDLLSVAYDQIGRADSALAAATRLEEYPQFGWESQRLWRHAPLRVARLALKIGDSTRARSALQRQVAQWKAADADVPDLVSARRLLSELGRP